MEEYVLLVFSVLFGNAYGYDTAYVICMVNLRKSKNAKKRPKRGKGPRIAPVLPELGNTFNDLLSLCLSLSFSLSHSASRCSTTQYICTTMQYIGRTIQKNSRLHPPASTIKLSNCQLYEAMSYLTYARLSCLLGYLGTRQWPRTDRLTQVERHDIPPSFQKLNHQTGCRQLIYSQSCSVRFYYISHSSNYVLCLCTMQQICETRQPGPF